MDFRNFMWGLVRVLKTGAKLLWELSVLLTVAGRICGFRA